jgi:hypothetical protein
MRDQRSYRTPSPEVQADRDRKFQRAVLGRVIELFPAQLSVSELVQELVTDPLEFGARDGIKRAAIDLAGLGVLHRHKLLNRDDELVLPTRTTLHLYALLEEDDQ